MKNTFAQPKNVLKNTQKRIALRVLARRKPRHQVLLFDIDSSGLFSKHG